MVTDQQDLKNHMDKRFDCVEQKLGKHHEMLVRHDTELSRLHNQHLNLLTSVQTMMSSFGSMIASINERTHKSEFLIAMLIVGGGVSIGMLGVILWKLFH